MTENEKYLEMPWSIEETIENLKIIKEHLGATVLKTNLDGKGKQDAKEVEFDFSREIQQYRAIGTVEEILNTFNTQQLKIASQHNELEEYRAIGTIDEFKALKDTSVAKKPIIKPWSAARCPSCDCSLSESLGDGYYQHFESLERCDKCNQKLDWQ